MEKKVLVIGSEGFIGKAFINQYNKQNNSLNEVYMVSRRNIKKTHYYSCDATKFEKINEIIKNVAPNEIYNFSGSFSNIFETDYLNNVVITKNIIESILINNNFDCKILINGSAAEFGFIKDYNKPINEDYPLNPISFYGLSKVFQTFLAKTYFHRNNVQIYIARPFNIIGYGISQKLFIGRLINEVKMNLEKKMKITVGNLNNERDYLDIKDLINAYNVIMDKGTPGEIYNIGSGKSIKIGDLLDLFLRIFKINRSEVNINKNFIRIFDIPKIIADTSKLKNLKWSTKKSLEDSILNIKKMIFKELKN